MESNIDPDTEIVERHVAQLGEHFESVAVLVSNYIGSENNTKFIHKSCGNLFALYGQADMFARELRKGLSD